MVPPIFNDIIKDRWILGYRKGSETGGMTKTIMRQDKELFEELVLTINPKIIICLGQITYEVVVCKTTKGVVKQLSKGIPFKAPFPLDKNIPVYGVAHCGSRGLSNIGGVENMIMAWKKIAKEYKESENG